MRHVSFTNLSRRLPFAGPSPASPAETARASSDVAHPMAAVVVGEILEILEILGGASLLKFGDAIDWIFGLE